MFALFDTNTYLNIFQINTNFHIYHIVIIIIYYYQTSEQNTSNIRLSFYANTQFK